MQFHCRPFLELSPAKYFIVPVSNKPAISSFCWPVNNPIFNWVEIAN